MQNRIRWLMGLALLVSAGPLQAQGAFDAEFTDTSLEGVDAVFYPNRPEDWSVRDGRLIALEDGMDKPMRTVHLMTHRIGNTGTGFLMGVVTGRADRGMKHRSDSWTGFLIGAGGDSLDVRNAARVFGQPTTFGGFIAGVDGLGRAFFRSFDERTLPLLGERGPAHGALPDSMLLRLQVDRRPSGYRISLLVVDLKDGKEISRGVLEGMDPESIVGNVALVSNPGATRARFWFSDWHIEGTSLEPALDPRQVAGAEVPGAVDPALQAPAPDEQSVVEPEAVSATTDEGSDEAPEKAPEAEDDGE